MPATPLGWFLFVLACIVLTVCLVIVINALGDNGAFR